MKTIPERAAKRAYDKWVADENGCYISTYSVGSHGCAQIGWTEDGKTWMTTAHRAAWVHTNGQIAQGFDVGHRPTCDKRCVNVDHLRCLSASNNRRRNKTDFPLGQSCVGGHSEADRVQTKNGMECRPCRNMSESERRRINPPDKARVRERKLITKYGVTQPEYDAMFDAQGGHCKLCPATSATNCEYLFVDHCHTTGRVRGLLCNHCNSMLGLARDNVDILRAAIDYLETSAALALSAEPIDASRFIVPIQPRTPALTSEQIEAIRLDTRSTRALGAEYGVSHTTIRRVKQGI